MSSAPEVPGLGDARFAPHYVRLKQATDPAAEIRAFSNDEVIAALAAASTREQDPYLSNILATEALNRIRLANAITGSMGEGVYALDVDGRLTFLNAAAEKMLGWSRQDIVGEDAHDTLHTVGPDGAPARRDACPVLQVLREGGTSVGHGEMFRRRDGSAFPVACTAAAILRDGEVEGVVVVFRDISERERAENAFQDSAARMRNTLHATLGGWQRNAGEGREARAASVPPPSWRARVFGDITAGYADALNYDAVDRFTTRLLWWNLGALAVLAFLNAGLGIPALFPSPFGWRVVSPVEAAGAMLLGVAAAGVPQRLRGRMGNHYAWRVLVSVAFTTFSYLIVFVTGGAIEAHFHFFMVLAYLMVYADWRLQWLVLGLTVVHHLTLGAVKPEWAFFYEDVRLVTLAHAIPVLATVLFTTALCENHRNGVRALESGRRVLVGEVAERRAAEGALNESRQRLMDLNAKLEERVDARTRELKEAVSELEAFSYSVSHDLRAPLRGVDFFSRSLLEDAAWKLEPEEREYLERLRGESHRLTNLVNDLLELSRASREELRYDPVDLSALAREVVDTLREDAPDRDVDVDVQEGITATADPRLMRVVLENLLGNAWKYTSRTPHARITFREEEHDGERVLAVRDNGPGFDMAHAERLFRAFQRLHAATEFEGTGLGLATVRRIIERHSGRIRAEGRPGEGAAFLFTLAPDGPVRVRASP